MFFFIILFPSFRIKEHHNCNPYAKWGVVSPEALLRGIFHSCPVLTAGRVKNWYHCAWLGFQSRLNSFFQYTKQKIKFCFNLCTFLVSHVRNFFKILLLFFKKKLPQKCRTCSMLVSSFHIYWKQTNRHPTKYRLELQCALHPLFQ